MTARICSGTTGKACGRIIPATSRRCADCQPVYTAQRNALHRDRRGTREQRGYDWSWRRLSSAYRARNPVCELRHEGCTFWATETDHTVPMRAGGRSTRANCTAVCRPCHRRKTADDAKRYPDDQAA